MVNNVCPIKIKHNYRMVYKPWLVNDLDLKEKAQIEN